MNKDIKTIIDKYNLTANSSPCEICRALNDIEIREFPPKKEGKKPDRAYFPRVPKCDRYKQAYCLDKDRAQVRLSFLQLAGDYLYNTEDSN